MKNLILLIISSLVLNAANHSNAGKQQNEYGYYGEGVVFGEYEIVGEWRICSKDIIVFNKDGTVDNGDNFYAVNENGSILTFGMYSMYSSTIFQTGDNGCFKILFTFSPSDFGTDISQTCTACKVNVDNRVYGPVGKSIDITLSAQ